MKIHLKRNEKLFLNGAVIRLDRRGSIELLNDAQFLLEAHIMQQEDAKRPLEQVYFIVQTMLMDPGNAQMVMHLFRAFAGKLRTLARTDAYRSCLTEVERLVEGVDYFGALKLLRRSFDLDSENATPAAARVSTERAA